MGGATVARKDQALRPAYAVAERLDKNTGELIPVLQTQYGDEAKERVSGDGILGREGLSKVQTKEHQ